MSTREQVVEEVEEILKDAREAAPFQSENAGRTEGLVRVHIGDPLHFEIQEFMEDESRMLDDNELMGWLGLMASDILYRMPVRMTKDRADGSEFSETMFHFDEDAMTLTTKVSRLALTQSAWAEKPPSRTRRFVTSIRVFRAASGEDEYEVRSSILLVRNRYQESELELVSARRTDVIRRTGEGFEIAKREIFVDQATIGTQNLAVFL